jgi:hypothetical protein
MTTNNKIQVVIKAIEAKIKYMDTVANDAVDLQYYGLARAACNEASMAKSELRIIKLSLPDNPCSIS